MSLFTGLLPAGHTAPIGKYSAGILVPLGAERALVFISGQVASDAQGKVIGVDDPARQAEAVFSNLEAVLREAGGGLRNLVSVTIYLTDMKHFDAVSQVRNRLLGDPPPASTLVQVSRLAIAEHLVEISGVAIVDVMPGELR